MFEGGLDVMVTAEQRELGGGRCRQRPTASSIGRYGAHFSSHGVKRCKGCVVVGSQMLYTDAEVTSTVPGVPGQREVGRAEVASREREWLKKSRGSRSPRSICARELLLRTSEASDVALFLSKHGRHRGSAL